ncbi:WAS/WASL-interacting protein family member 2 [Triticum aestivum]|uniref:WAS/WASL-interacting protein family member 2 n=1 Tax=Triticum aestivum TaxID=4565 RepID=UPI001D00CBA3|nr:WAS/WASL-interacting protein family member 2-like [Triticum aestivum]
MTGRVGEEAMVNLAKQGRSGRRGTTTAGQILAEKRSGTVSSGIHVVLLTVRRNNGARVAGQRIWRRERKWQGTAWPGGATAQAGKGSCNLSYPTNGSTPLPQNLNYPTRDDKKRIRIPRPRLDKLHQCAGLPLHQRATGASPPPPRRRCLPLPQNAAAASLSTRHRRVPTFSLSSSRRPTLSLGSGRSPPPSPLALAAAPTLSLCSGRRPRLLPWLQPPPPTLSLGSGRRPHPLPWLRPPPRTPTVDRADAVALHQIASPRTTCRHHVLPALPLSLLAPPPAEHLVTSIAVQHFLQFLRWGLRLSTPTADPAHSNPSTTLPPPAGEPPLMQHPGRSLSPPRAVQQDIKHMFSESSSEAGALSSTLLFIV